jgi:MFS family permease
VTRIGVGGMPFLLPLLYQVGLGRSPLESGLLILPQPVAAMASRLLVPRLLRRLGYRRILLSNTLVIALLIGLFALIGPGTPVWQIVGQAFAFGFVSSLQYTSMNTLAYADVTDADASRASTIASTAQQMSMSFGVAAASLTAALFIPERSGADALAFIRGVHRAFLALGAFTALSTLIFRALTSADGAAVSRHKIALRSEA